MSAIVDVMLAAQTVTTLTAAGLVVVLFAIIVVLLRSRATHRHLEHTLALIEEHRVHEARIYARSAGAPTAPLVAALSSEPSPPRRPSVLLDVLLGTICVIPVAALVTFGVAVMIETTNPQTIPTAAAVMVGLTVLLPSTVIGGLAIAHVNVRTARRMRGGCIQAMAALVSDPEADDATGFTSVLDEDGQ